MDSQEIFLAAMEAKDIHCLEPLIPTLESGFASARLFDPYSDIVSGKEGTIRAFAEAEFPVVVIASVGSIDTLNLIRPRDSYLCIGLEHGIAPFKSYTYGSALLSSDYYLAPTRGWTERLLRLYPEQRAKVRLGGYPKIDAMRDRLCQARAGAVSDSHLSQHPRIVVLFSWGIGEDAWRLLPDHAFIDYILHPADHLKADGFKFKNARVHVSEPNTTYSLIGDASIILGDFSSLTLECIHLGKTVSFLLDANLYEASCDVDASFTMRDSPHFGAIPFTEHRIERKQALTASDFLTFAERFGRDIQRWAEAMPRASFAPEFLPPKELDNREICGSAIRDIVDGSQPLSRTPAGVRRSRQALDNLGFLAQAYPALLRRPPDPSGLKHYLPIVEHAKDAESCANAIAACRELNCSAEAASVRGGPLNEDPLEKILAILAGQADAHPDRALHTLDALNEDLLPQFHRRRFEDASTDSEKVAYGARLVANRKATGADLVALAHACARSERLTEALSWILRAIEIQPFDGELLRFQASVLERLGKIDDALLVAEAARNLECDIGAVSADIVRLQERQSAQVRKFMATASPADRLAGYAKLVLSRRASVEDLIFLAQAAADEENLVDALEWISKAIDMQSHDGELHRFRATILERLSRFEEAHDAVTLASSRGADQHAVAGDIVRIRSLVIDEFRQRAREGDLAEFIICHGKLLRLGVLQADDLLILAWRIAAAPFRWVMIRSFDAIRRRATVGRGSQTASAPGRRAEAAS